MLRKLFLTLGICMSLAACQTLSGGGSDQYSAESLSQNLKVGVTTSQEVRNLYGKPDYTSDGPSGPSYWSYRLDSGTNSMIQQAVGFIPVFGVSSVADQLQENRSLHIHFENNRVSSYSLDNSQPK